VPLPSQELHVVWCVGEQGMATGIVSVSMWRIEDKLALYYHHTIWHWNVLLYQKFIFLMNIKWIRVMGIDMALKGCIVFVNNVPSL
jgi:hypothetical protein